MRMDKSRDLFEKARRLLPGGVDSPVRAFRAVGGQPLFIERGQGPYLFDVDGNRYVDYVLSWGPLIVGHAHPRVIAALTEAAGNGTSFGAPSPLELELAQLVMEFIPAVEMIRFVNSGTEAVMSALRLARAYTGRSKIVKFEGCYHGHADLLLVKAGSGVATLGLADTPGIPQGAIADTLLAPYNDLEATARLFDLYPGQIAAVIVEPVAGNMGVVPPLPGFLGGLRQLTEASGALLIFDEVMTGFRVHPGGAQVRFGVRPDLTTLGKVIGGGLPVGAFGGRSEIMELIAPSGPVYQAGTLSGNPLAMAAGIATLSELKRPGAWEAIEDRARQLEEGLQEAIQKVDFPARVQRVGTMFTLFFTREPVIDFATARSSDLEGFAAFHRSMLDAGIYLPPSQFEASFLSSAHTADDIEMTVRAAEKALMVLQHR